MARKVGVPNRRSGEFREILNKIKFDIPKEAAKLYPTLSPMMKFKMLEFLASYCYPKLFAKVIDESNEAPEPMTESTETLLAQVDAVAAEAEQINGSPTG